MPVLGLICSAGMLFLFYYLTVSNLALNEYELLNGKFEVEQNCRTKAEEFATNVSHWLRNGK